MEMFRKSGLTEFKVSVKEIIVETEPTGNNGVCSEIIIQETVKQHNIDEIFPTLPVDLDY